MSSSKHSNLSRVLRLCTLALALPLSAIVASAQPGNGGGPPQGGQGGGQGGGGGGQGGGASAVSGQSSSSSCPSVSTCAADGSSNYVSRSLDYDASTGIFSGSLTFNQCPKWNGGDTKTASANCVQQKLPAITSTPAAAALRGAVGYTLYGVNIYGPYEAGFQAGFVCSNGTCEGGLDVPLCRAKMARDCGGVSKLDETLLSDACGGHASPYHHHLDLPCDYDITSSASHSKLVGWGLDGRGIYGRWESNGKVPTDLDACNGHYGPVPAMTIGGVTYPAASNVYHYHLTTDAPYTLGCYGPVKKLDECKALYPSTCGTGFTDICTLDGEINYDTDCPCYRQKSTNETYNDKIQSTSSCPAIEGLTTISVTAKNSEGKSVEVILAETKTSGYSSSNSGGSINSGSASDLNNAVSATPTKSVSATPSGAVVITTSNKPSAGTKFGGSSFIFSALSAVVVTVAGLAL